MHAYSQRDTGPPFCAYVKHIRPTTAIKQLKQLKLPKFLFLRRSGKFPLLSLAYST